MPRTRGSAKRLPIKRHHSITSSARARNISSISISIALAILRFMTRLNLVGAWRNKTVALEQTEGRAMKTLKIGDVTITSLIERDGPWRKPEEMFPAYDPVAGKRYLAELDPVVFDPASGKMV